MFKRLEGDFNKKRLRPFEPGDWAVGKFLYEVDAALDKLTVNALNAAADEFGFPEHFYFFRWERTAFPAADSDGLLRFTFSFKGRVQF